MKCITHSQEQPITVGGIALDLSPLVAAIKENTEVLRHMSPVVNVPAVPVVVQVPEMSPTPVSVTLPEMSPTVEVHPPEVVIQKTDGTLQPMQPVIELSIPWWAIIAIGAPHLIALIINMVLQFHG